MANLPQQVLDNLPQELQFLEKIIAAMEKLVVAMHTVGFSTDGAGLHVEKARELFMSNPQVVNAIMSQPKDDTETN